MDETAIDLSKTKWAGKDTPMFNVTVLTNKGNKKIEKHVSETLHTIELDFDDIGIIGPMGLQPFVLGVHENKMV